MDLSIIIANFNTKNLLARNLSLLYINLQNCRFEIIVVDDHSTDGSAAMLKQNFPGVTLIKNRTNQGYSKSYNKGTKLARGKYILHLNSDMFLGKKTDFGQLLDFMDQRKEIGILGIKIVRPNGRLDLPGKRSFPTPLNVFFQTTGLAYLFPQNRLFGEYYLTYLDENKMHEVDCLMGAFMLIRRAVLDKIGLIDERFFMFGEDIDFCLRTRQAGWKIIYYPKIIFTHLHGGTTSLFKLKYLTLFHHAMILYYDKHFAPRNSPLVNLLIYLGIYARFLFCLLLMPLLNFFSLLSSLKTLTPQSAGQWDNETINNL